jgi:hypothetical protein
MSSFVPLAVKRTAAPSFTAVREGTIQRCAAAPCSVCSAQEDEQSVMRQRAFVSGEPPTVPAIVRDVLRSRGQPLDAATRALFEPRFGHDFSGVRIHADETAARAADAIGATAFTVGSSISFGRGMYQPGTAPGLQLLAHELTHTVQQRGRIASAQPSLRVGAANDAAESTAERVANAVLAGQSIPRIGATGAIIRRKPKVSPVANDPSLRIVEMDNGTRYRVKRTVEWVKTTTKHSGATTKFGGDIDKDNVWIQVDHCDGTGEVKVKVGANIPAAAQDVLKKAGQAIVGGADPVTALKGIKLEPFVSVIVAQSKKSSVTVTGKVTTDIDKGKVTGGAAGVTVKVPGADFSLEGKIEQAPPGQKRPNFQVGGVVTIPLGSGPPKVECPSFERTTQEPRVSYQCEKIVPEHEEERTRPVTRSQTQSFYFKYARNEFAKKGRTADLDNNAKAAVTAALKDGYRIVSISGYASPEGPMPRKTKGFEGNEALSADRAKAAEDWVKTVCPPPTALSMRPSCFADEYRRGEQHELYGKKKNEQGAEVGPELEGKELETFAVGQFETEEAEKSRRTPDVMDELAKGKTPERQKDTVYPLLRRAEITLSKQETETYKETVKESSTPESCPQDVMDAADEDFGREPLVKK